MTDRQNRADPVVIPLDPIEALKLILQVNPEDEPVDDAPSQDEEEAPAE
jgi:hypothetical protein